MNVSAYLDQTAAADDARAAAIHRAWHIYRGNHPKPLKVREGEPDDNVRLNLAGLVVDTGVDALFGQDLVLSITSGGTTDERASEYVRGVFEANREMLLLQSAATNGAVAGHAAIRLLPPVAGAPTGTLPRLLVVDPEMLRVVWHPDDVGTVEAYVLQWSALTDDGKEAGHRQIIQRDGTGWMITEQVSDARGRGDWITTDETAWKYGWSPIVDTQNLPEPNAYWGRPDLTSDVLETQLAVNRVMSNAARVQRIHGHPKIVAKGVGDGDLDVGPDEAIILPDSDSDLFLLEPRGGVEGHLAMFAAVKAALHEISRVPEITAGRLDGVGQLSGLALKILYGPLIRKTEVKRRLYGAMVEALALNLCEFGGVGGDNLAAAIRWPEIVPTDPADQAAAAEAMQRAGVSQATTLAAMGFDAEAEATQRAAEQTNIGAALLTAFDSGKGA